MFKQLICLLVQINLLALFRTLLRFGRFVIASLFVSSVSWCAMIYDTYCKRGYFRWGKISWKCWQDISRGGNFHDTAPFSFIKSYGFYFSRGGNFREEDQNAKIAKITPTRKFPRLQYSNLINLAIDTFSQMRSCPSIIARDLHHFVLRTKKSSQSAATLIKRQ